MFHCVADSVTASRTHTIQQPIDCTFSTYSLIRRYFHGGYTWNVMQLRVLEWTLSFQVSDHVYRQYSCIDLWDSLKCYFICVSDNPLSVVP
jgi:hypothetical protein